MHEDDILILLEDLNAMGFGVRKTTINLDDVKLCLQWLARFHTTFLNTTPDGLWEAGSYWHLGTRPDEWERMENPRLKNAARPIDEKLSKAHYQTIIHGDAKLANFCFSEDSRSVAAVDFQYVGGGCGMKDVAYFLSSCLDEEACERHESELLDYYFSELESNLSKAKYSSDKQGVINEWRSLYKYAWADFYRFLDGWSPGHWKMHEYSRRMTDEVIKEISRK